MSTTKDLERLGLIPPKERLEKGGVAVIECPQVIPCDPCVAPCPRGAIIKKELNEIPKVDFDKCTGCGLCIRACPGLAVFIVDMSGVNAKVTLPYEFLPVPKKGDVVIALGRSGQEMGEARVVATILDKAAKVASVTIEVDKEVAMEVRSIRIP